jgi:transcription termination/antitermination protein NusG
VIDHPQNMSHGSPDDPALEAATVSPAAGAAVPPSDGAQAGAPEGHAENLHAPESQTTAAHLPPNDAQSEEILADEPLADEREPVAEVEEEPRGPIEEIAISDEPPKLNWYILKVQSNREESIREGLQRRVAVAGLEKYFEEIIVPTEMVSEFKGGKKRVVKRKLYPGYLVVHMEINEDTWFLVRETPGIGDFTGSAGKPTPMLAHEVAKIVAKQEEKADEAPKLKINFNVGDRVKINEGTFENFEGEVDGIDEASGRVTVMINIFGRSTPVELEYWQIEAV